MIHQFLDYAGLRALQGRKQLDNLVTRVKAARDEMPWGPAGAPPLLVKIAPDLTTADKIDVATIALKRGLDGLVISNTTISRPPEVRDHPSGDEVNSLTRPQYSTSKALCPADNATTSIGGRHPESQPSLALIE